MLAYRSKDPLRPPVFANTMTSRLKYFAASIECFIQTNWAANFDVSWSIKQTNSAVDGLRSQMAAEVWNKRCVLFKIFHLNLDSHLIVTKTTQEQPACLTKSENTVAAKWQMWLYSLSWNSICYQPILKSAYLVKFHNSAAYFLHIKQVLLNLKKIAHTLLTAARPIIFFGGDQSLMSSVTDVYRTVENWHKTPVKFLANLVRVVMAPSTSFWLRHSLLNESLPTNWTQEVH